MQKTKHLYFLNYDYNEKDLCELESKYLFNKKAKDKLLFTDITVIPSNSAFIKKRLDIISESVSYAELIQQIKNENIYKEDFKVEYLVLDNDPTGYKDRLQKSRDIGFSIEGEAEYTNPTTFYGLCFYQEIWYFGEIIKNSFDWHNHKDKPNSFSNSISMSIAKTLLNIATKSNIETTVLDTCCGVGTILLEGAFAGYNITGCDINQKICNYAKENLLHFNYSTKIINSDIVDVTQNFEAAIIDLPYNHFTKIEDDVHEHIINSAVKITDNLLIISTTDITKLIHSTGSKITDICVVTKKGKKVFSRKIWVCER
jgi:tRNA G10  N-methylase Trm11